MQITAQLVGLSMGPWHNKGPQLQGGDHAIISSPQSSYCRGGILNSPSPCPACLACDAAVDVGKLVNTWPIPLACERAKDNLRPAIRTDCYPSKPAILKVRTIDEHDGLLVRQGTEIASGQVRRKLLISAIRSNA